MTNESTFEKLKAGGFTPKAVGFAIPFCLLWSYIFVVGTSQGRSAWPTPALFLLVLFETFISKALGERAGFTPQEWAVFITISISGMMTGSVLWDAPMAGNRGPDAYWGGSMGGNRFAWMLVNFHQYSVSIENEWAIFPGLHPSDPLILADLATGGVPTPWGAFMSTIFYWIISMIALYLSLYFIMLIFRKPWIDVEKLTFPHTVAQSELVKMSEKQDRPSLFDLKSTSSKAFWGVFVIGSFMPILRGLNYYMNLGLWTTINQNLMGINLAPYLGEMFPGFGFNWGATGWAMWTPFIYFMPLNLIYSLIITWVVKDFVFPAAFKATGTAPPGGHWNYGTSQGPIAYQVMTSGSNGASGYGGAFFGIALWLIWRYRNSITHSIQAAISGVPREPGEPHSWRVVWIGIVGCALAYLLVNIGYGMSGLFVLSYILFIVNIVARMRIVAEVGRTPFTWAWYMNAMNRDAWSLFGYDVSNVSDPSLVQDAILTNVLYRGDFEFNYSSLTAFKYGDNLGADSRSIGWAYILGILVSFVVSVPLSVWLTFSVGRDTLLTGLGEHIYIPLGWGGTGPVPLNFLDTNAAEIANQPNYQMWVFAGTIVTFVLFWLQANIGWWFYNPIALAVPTWAPGGFIVFGLLKWASLRLGARTYREIGTPAVTGWIAAQAFWACLIYLAFMWG